MIIDDILYMLKEITLRTGYPVPISKKEVYSWAEGLELKSKGSTYLYTGALYQIMPYIRGLVNTIERLSKGRTTSKILSIAKVFVKFPHILKPFVKAEEEEIEISRKVLRSIALLLNSANVDYSYLYQDDLYSGVLLYDLGLEEEFSLHAKKVAEILRNRGVKKIITVDPHTTFIMKNIYPKFIDSFDVEVNSYIEVLAENLPAMNFVQKDKVVIHDPCFYARYENIIEEPRKILEISGFEVLEPKRSRSFTFCCGGPIESLYPGLSERIARERVKELSSLSNTIITLCPICYSNLSRVKPKDVEIVDIALAIARKRGEKI